MKSIKLFVGFFLLITLAQLSITSATDPYARRVRQVISLAGSCSENEIAYDMVGHAFGVCTDTGFKTILTSGAALSALTYSTSTNCADSAGAAACGSAAAGAFVIDVGSTSTVVSTSAVTANSEIKVQFDSSLGTRLGITCNTTPATVAFPSVSARTAGVSFTVSVSGSVGTNPACFDYTVVN